MPRPTVVGHVGRFIDWLLTDSQPKWLQGPSAILLGNLDHMSYRGVDWCISLYLFSQHHISVAVLVKCQSRLGRVVFTFGWVLVDNWSTDWPTRSCDSIGTLLAMYQWTVGWVLVRYRWSISWQSGLPVQLFSSCCHSHWFCLHPTHCEKFSLAFFTP